MLMKRYIIGLLHRVKMDPLNMFLLTNSNSLLMKGSTHRNKKLYLRHFRIKLDRVRISKFIPIFKIILNKILCHHLIIRHRKKMILIFNSQAVKILLLWLQSNVLKNNLKKTVFKNQLKEKLILQ